MVQIIDCEKIANQYLNYVSEELKKINLTPNVKIFFNPKQNSDCLSYLTSIINTFKKTGINSIPTIVQSASDLETRIINTYKETTTTGCLILYPTRFPKKKDKHFMKIVPPYKDVEGLSEKNVSRLNYKDIHFPNTNKQCKAVAPCTPRAVQKILEHYNIKIKSKDITIINRSYLIGMPLGTILGNLGASVTTFHKDSKKKSILSSIKNADIIITAVPQKTELFNSTHIKKGATIIDLSFDGNFNPEEISQKTKCLCFKNGKNYIGKVTTAMLCLNTLYLSKYQEYLQKKNSFNNNKQTL